MAAALSFLFAAVGSRTDRKLLATATEVEANRRVGSGGFSVG